MKLELWLFLGAATLATPALWPEISAQSGGETFSATASVKGPQGLITAPVTIVIERFTTEDERAKALQALKEGATPGLRKHLETTPAVGRIEVGERTATLKYAYARPVGRGRLITVITDKPIAYLGSKLPSPKPKTGYEVAFALLTVPGSGKGSGELGPASKAKISASGTVVTEDYGAEVVTLSDIEKKP